MKYRRIGNTDINASILSFGASALGSVFRATDDAESVNVVREALQAGINYIDTAPWYGQTKSEYILGKALQGVPRDSYYLATKVGRYEKQVDKLFDFSAEKTLRSVDESLHRLGVEYLDVIQVHDMEFSPDLNIIINETLPALEKVRQQGKARYIGITGYPLENFRTVLERSKTKVDTILTYCRCSMNDSSLADYIPYFKEKGVGIVNASALSMGLLTDRGPPSWHPASDVIKQECRRAAEFCQSRNVDLSRIAIKYTLENDMVDTTLISTASLENLKKNLKVTEEELSANERGVLEEVLNRFMRPLNNANWEGKEVSKYWEELEQSKTTEGGLQTSVG